MLRRADAGHRLAEQATGKRWNNGNTGIQLEEAANGYSASMSVTISGHIERATRDAEFGKRSAVFWKGAVRLIHAYEAEIHREVDGWERNRVLASSESDLVTYLVEKYTLQPPRLLVDQMHIENEGEAKIDISGRFEYDVRDRSRPYHVPGSFVVVAIPFEGDGDLFEFKASTFNLNPPRGRVSGSSVLLSFQGVNMNAARTREAIDSTVGQIERHLEWIRGDCGGWNGRVETVAEQCVRQRKARLLEQADLVSALGLPMKRRPDSAVVSAIPVVRKERPVVLPRAPVEAFVPEPALPDAEYDYILNVIDNMSRNIERSPSTFVQMKEEQIRDMILVNLNGHYEGDATGETFNAQGQDGYPDPSGGSKRLHCGMQVLGRTKGASRGDRSDTAISDLA